MRTFSKRWMMPLCALVITGCSDTGPEGEPATRMTISASSAYTWKLLCKRVTLNFTDDNGAAHRWGRDEALTLTVTNATPYPSSSCSGTPLNNLYLGPENTSAVFWVKSTQDGEVDISVGGSLTAGMSLTTELPTAKLVLGQADFTGISANRGGSANAGTMSGPNGITTCGGKLFVADTGNNRVLGWTSTPTTNGQSASFILTAASSTGTNQNLVGPTDVACDGNTLYVVDAGNNRILGYSPVPSSATTAKFVWGSSATGSPGTASASQTTDGPLSIALYNGALATSSIVLNRILFWNTAPYATSGAATGAPNYVLGQTGFGGSAFGSTADKLKTPYGVRLRDGYLIAGDTGNARVLLYSTPISTGASATRILTTARSGAAAGPLVNPTMADYDGDHLIVADTGNARLVIWNGMPDSDSTAASLAVGAGSSFSTSGNGGVLNGSGTITSGDSTEGVYAYIWIDGSYMWVSDYNLHRVVAFPAP